MRIIKIVTFLLVVLFLISGCQSEELTKKKEENDKIYEIVKYEFYGENEEKIDADGNIIGFGLYANGEYTKRGNVKKIKILYKKPNYFFGEGYIGFDLELISFEEEKFIIVNDLYDKNYNWIEFDYSQAIRKAILHIK